MIWNSFVISCFCEFHYILIEFFALLSCRRHYASQICLADTSSSKLECIFKCWKWLWRRKLSKQKQRISAHPTCNMSTLKFVVIHRQMFTQPKPIQNGYQIKVNHHRKRCKTEKKAHRCFILCWWASSVVW